MSDNRTTRVTIRLSADERRWLEEDCRNGQAKSLSHAVRLAVSHGMRRKKSTGKQIPPEPRLLLYVAQTTDDLLDLLRRNLDPTAAEFISEEISRLNQWLAEHARRTSPEKGTGS